MPAILQNAPPPAPRSTYTVSDALDRVRGDLGYRNGNLITDDDIIRWMNEAQDDLAVYSHWLRLSTAIDSVSGQAEYSLPLRTIAIEEVRYNSNRLAVTSTEQLYQMNYNWRRIATGTPTRYYGRGNSSFGLFVTPGPSAPGNGNIQVIYTAVPPKVTAPLDSFYLPYGWDRLLIVAGKIRASEKDTVGEGAARLPDLRNEWREGREELRREVMSMAEGEVWSMGEQALYNQMDRSRPLFSFDQYSQISR